MVAGPEYMAQIQPKDLCLKPGGYAQGAGRLGIMWKGHKATSYELQIIADYRIDPLFCRFSPTDIQQGQIHRLQWARAVHGQKGWLEVTWDGHYLVRPRSSSRDKQRSGWRSRQRSR